MASEKEIALYYPYIDIDDSSLIKTAALYWDELWTIVPESVRGPYQSPYSKEAFKEGFLKPRIVYPADDIVQKTGKEFSDDIQKETVLQHVIALIKSSKRKRFTKIHFDKWAPQHLMEILLALREEDLSLSPIDDDYMMFPAPIGDTYMSRLASVISQADGSVPLTDSLYCHDIAIDRYVDYESDAKATQAQLVMLSFNAIAVKPDVPLLDVLRFRGETKNRKLLSNFRRAIRNVSRHIREDSPARQYELIKQAVEDEILPGKEEIERKLRESEIQFDIVAVAVALQALISVVSSSENPWYAAAGGAVSLAAILGCSIRQDRVIVKDNPFGYLYQIQKHLGEHT